MAEQPGPGFAGLLRQLRTEAKLTQEELAEAAGLSPRSVSDLERGINRTARKDTAVLLAGALGLAGPVRVLFVAAARGRGPDPAETSDATGRLLDFYLHAALAAGRHFTPGATAYRRAPRSRWPGQAPDVSTLGQAAS